MSLVKLEGVSLPSENFEKRISQIEQQLRKEQARQKESLEKSIQDLEDATRKHKKKILHLHKLIEKQQREAEELDKKRSKLQKDKLNVHRFEEFVFFFFEHGES